jgi:hypothetical protein
MLGECHQPITFDSLIFLNSVMQGITGKNYTSPETCRDRKPARAYR